MFRTLEGTVQSDAMQVCRALISSQESTRVGATPFQSKGVQ